MGCFASHEQVARSRFLPEDLDESHDIGTSQGATSSVDPGLPTFEDILSTLRRYEETLGGLETFKHKRPVLPSKKIPRKSLVNHYTHYEYVYLTVLGFQQLHKVVEDIIKQNNGKFYKHNPGTRLLENKCGFTMHGDRKGANAVLRDSAPALLRAFRLATEGSSDKSTAHTRFFEEAFCRFSDPCLEGRYGRILMFMERIMSKDLGDSERPWEDFSVKPLKGCNAMTIIGEHLRVFTNEMISRWAEKENIPYLRAKKLHGDIDALSKDNLVRVSGFLSDLDVLCNALTFQKYLRKHHVVPQLISLPEACMAIQLFVSLDTLSPAPANGARGETKKAQNTKSQPLIGDVGRVKDAVNGEKGDVREEKNNNQMEQEEEKTDDEGLAEWAAAEEYFDALEHGVSPTSRALIDLGEEEARDTEVRDQGVLPQPGVPMNAPGSPVASQQPTLQAQVSVKLPDNVFPGQEVDVPTPEGDMMRITVPPNVRGGQHITMQYIPKVSAVSTRASTSREDLTDCGKSTTLSKDDANNRNVEMY